MYFDKHLFCFYNHTLIKNKSFNVDRRNNEPNLYRVYFSFGKKCNYIDEFDTKFKLSLTTVFDPLANAFIYFES